MGQDISAILKKWEFDPHELNVRVVAADDGRPLLQMRIDLGLLQMEMQGRPDGLRPQGCESLLDYFEAQAKQYGKGFELDEETIDTLFREGWQYYQRYLSLFHIGHYDLVVRDTCRSLRLFSFVRKYARRKRDKWRFDQYRPYVVMMNTRAESMLALEKSDRDKALKLIDEGCEQIEQFLIEYGKAVDSDQSFELEFLRQWKTELEGEIAGSTSASPERRLTELRSNLDKAIDLEDYEYAALLRDQIRQIEETK